MWLASFNWQAGEQRKIRCWFQLLSVLNLRKIKLLASFVVLTCLGSGLCKEGNMAPDKRSHSLDVFPGSVNKGFGRVKQILMGVFF